MPLDVSRAGIRASGGQIMLVGNCRSGWASDVVRWDDTHVESGSTPHYAGFPACDATYPRQRLRHEARALLRGQHWVSSAVSPTTSPQDAEADSPDAGEGRGDGALRRQPLRLRPAAPRRRSASRRRSGAGRRTSPTRRRRLRGAASGRALDHPPWTAPPPGGLRERGGVGPDAEAETHEAPRPPAAHRAPRSACPAAAMRTPCCAGRGRGRGVAGLPARADRPSRRR